VLDERELYAVRDDLAAELAVLVEAARHEHAA
jgi:hypothetical protein